MAVPNIFATATTSIPLSQLDANFAYFANAITVNYSSTALTIDSSGNVGVGQTSPSKKLCVANSGAAEISLDPFGRSGETATSILSYNRSTSAYIPIHIDGSVQQFYTSGTEKMRIDNSGNVGIGTSSPDRRLKIGGSGASFGIDAGSGTISIDPVSSGVAQIDVSGANALRFNTNGAERVRIDSAGQVTFEKTITPKDRIVSIGTYNATAAAGANMHIASDGAIYQATSSLRYKKDIENTPHGLADVMKLRPVLYRGTSKSDGDRFYGGLIAEEVEDAGLSEFVSYNAEGEVNSLYYGNMVSLAFKAIQELKKELDAVKAELKALKGA